VRGWDTYLSERDKALFPFVGFGRRAGYGRRPVILVVDVSYSFTGDRPADSIFDSVARWPNSCGAEAWDGVANIGKLLEVARKKRLPIFYTTGSSRPVAGEFGLGRWADKMERQSEELRNLELGNRIVEEIAPRETDLVIEKEKPSAFFGTLFSSYLTDLGADSIITCGATTSGCVRSSVIDGFSYNYRMVVVEEATFDRGEASHWISLFDMHMKYADVVSLDEVLEYIEDLDDDLFVERMPILGCGLRAAGKRDH
jgi:nicotinamidase-related amidase